MSELLRDNWNKEGDKNSDNELLKNFNKSKRLGGERFSDQRVVLQNEVDFLRSANDELEDQLQGIQDDEIASPISKKTL